MTHADARCREGRCSCQNAVRFRRRSRLELEGPARSLRTGADQFSPSPADSVRPPTRSCAQPASNLSDRRIHPRCSVGSRSRGLPAGGCINIHFQAGSEHRGAEASAPTCPCRSRPSKQFSGRAFELEPRPARRRGGYNIRHGSVASAEAGRGGTPFGVSATSSPPLGCRSRRSTPGGGRGRSHAATRTPGPKSKAKVFRASGAFGPVEPASALKQLPCPDRAGPWARFSACGDCAGACT